MNPVLAAVEPNPNVPVPIPVPVPSPEPPKPEVVPRPNPVVVPPKADPVVVLVPKPPLEPNPDDKEPNPPDGEPNPVDAGVVPNPPSFPNEGVVSEVPEAGVTDPKPSPPNDLLAAAEFVPNALLVVVDGAVVPNVDPKVEPLLPNPPLVPKLVLG